ncbi:hypothetical protein Athai_11580 [Actinocatenispora thailandica]|uniref:DinB family protein n=2 Tax=Actinocatenispora thailandica TaxID=227318 RepID=A0A7R7DL03_9ACTN|nr:hypothetical protein Athai_11580 [Actinocatenispora thailandica]
MASEQELLVRFLTGQREAFRQAVAGLDEKQARSAPSASALSLAVLVKHCIDGERTMINRVAGAPEAADPVAKWQAGWQLTDADTVPALFAEWDEVGRRTEQVLLAETDLDRVVDIPANVRQWLPNDTAYTVRWLVLHSIEELARHAGHADVVRESIDGAVGHGAKQQPGTGWG